LHDKNWDLIKLTYNRPQKIANRIMDNIPNDQFELQHLKHTKLALSASERNRLLRYGSWASALESGAIKPKNEKQVAFVSMCHGKREPHSDFEFLWLRYRTACETDKTIDDLQKKLDKAINKAEQAKEKLDQLRKSFIERIDRSSSEVKSQQLIINELVEKISRYEAQLGMASTVSVSAQRSSRAVCPNCGGDGGASGQCYKCDGTGWVGVAS
jgi:uncharacterized protein YifE (UPF0438 family)